ncbi:MAG: nicotinamide riboside transporter PnuC [Muribaculaceae bacterium]|nr:nicotinamide riboside transporter PnuC [Muribaculaceae bacterium]
MENILTFDRLLEISGFALGIIYLWYEYHASARMWVVGIIMPMISTYVYYSAGLYADMMMAIYYIIIAVYGFVSWKFLRNRAGTVSDTGKTNKKELPITKISCKTAICAVLWFCPIYALIAWWLVDFTNSTVPYLDAFTTAASIIGSWLLAKKYLEQWLVWIVVDAVTSGLLIYKDRPFYAVLYGLYTIIAVAGYLKWKKLMKSQNNGLDSVKAS